MPSSRSVRMIEGVQKVFRGNHTVAFAMVLALIALVSWVGWFEVQKWHSAHDRGEAFVSALAAVMAENMARAIEVTDTALRSVQSANETVTNEPGFSADPRDTFQVLSHIKRLASALPQVSSLALADGQGVIRLSSVGDLIPTPLRVSDREYFTIFQKNQPQNRLYVGEPMKSRTSGRWFVGLSRPLLGEEQTFQGVALATLDVAWIQYQLRRMSTADDLSVALLSAKGRVVSATFQNEPETVFTGQPRSAVPLLAAVPLSDVLHGPSESTVLFQTQGAAAAIKRVSRWPLAVVVFQSHDGVYGDFERDLVRDMGLLTVVILGLTGMWWPLSRAMRDRDRLFDLSPDPVCVTDASGHFLRVNPAWQHVLGFASEEMVSTSHLDFVHPLDREDARRLFARLLAGESVQDIPLRYKGRKGRSVWLSWSAVGDRGRVFAIARDITHRRDTEHALAKSEARFRDVAEALGEFIWEVDARGDVLYLSERAQATLGISPCALLGHPMQSILDEKSGEQFAQLRRQGGPFAVEMVAKRWQTEQSRENDDGGTAWIRFSGVPVHGADGSVVGFRGAGVDVTESRASRQALAESEARYRSIVNTVVDGIIMLDEHAVMQSINPAVETIFGYLAEELVGQTVTLLVPHVFAGDVPGDTVLRASSRQEMTGVRKGGASFFVELGISEVYVEAHRFFICVCRDVSERKRVERLKDEFVSTVSHELRTPLTSIRGSLGLIAGKTVGPLPMKAQRLVDIAYANCERLVTLVNDILDIQKIEAGGMTFDMANVDLFAVVRRAMDENASYAQSYDVSMALESAFSTLRVTGDFDRLLQVVTNLLSNALKFSPQGDRVLIRISLNDRGVLLDVKDHGPGISEDFRPRVFDKFTQADATDTRAKGGTGLGLSISRAIAERHGGDVTFDSVPGHGATFTLYLPLGADEGKAGRAQQPS